MDTKKIGLEEISAFADGEAVDDSTEAILAALRQQEVRGTWDIYHNIGDALRSDDLAFAMRPDFAARIAARLEAEPTIMAPPARPASEPPAEAESRRARGVFQRYGMPGVAAAAVAAVALLGAPHWMAAISGQAGSPAVIASATSSVAGTADAEAGGPQNRVVAVKAQNGVILRDPRIDDYLLAHQRFSPSVYSTAQYARSAAFSTDSTK